MASQKVSGQRQTSNLRLSVCSLARLYLHSVYKKAKTYNISIFLNNMSSPTSEIGQLGNKKPTHAL